jgi:hypothetical protein
MKDEDVTAIHAKLKAATKASKAGDVGTTLGRIREAQRMLAAVIDRMNLAAGAPHSDRE